MNSIYKYELQFTHSTDSDNLTTSTSLIYVPKPVKLLTVGLQAGKIHAWYEVDKDAMNGETTEIKFFLFGTGWSVPEGLTYVGTVYQGTYVWHIYTE